MARSPILPSNVKDPTGVDKLERGAMREWRRRVRRCLKVALEALDKIPARLVVNARYIFDLDPALLSAIFAGIDTAFDDILLEGGPERSWFFETYVSVAYNRGTSQTYANIANQSSEYKAGVGSLQQLMARPEYRRRTGVVNARVFEEMKGLSDSMKVNMKRVLTDGVARGLNPREVSKNLTEQAGIEARRADRIARTEVSTALRRAKWDERDEAEARYGVSSKLMHMSALSATTRTTHAVRHGRLFTTDEVRDWYSQDGNSINCKCSQTEVLVDEDGNPLNKTIQARARARYESMRERHAGPWSKEKK